MVEQYAMIMVVRANGLFDHRLLRHIRVPDCDNAMISNKANEYCELINSIMNPCEQRELIIGLLESTNIETRVINSIGESLQYRTMKCPDKVSLNCTYGCILALLRESEYCNGSTVHEPIMHTELKFIGNGMIRIDDSIGHILQYDPEIITSITDIVGNRNVVTTFAIDINGVHVTHLCIVYI
jgi:hypothetical protein